MARKFPKTDNGSGGGFRVTARLVYKGEERQVDGPIDYIKVVQHAGALLRHVLKDNPPFLLTCGRSTITSTSDFEALMARAEDGDVVTIQVAIDKQNRKAGHLAAMDDESTLISMDDDDRMTLATVAGPSSVPASSAAIHSDRDLFSKPVDLGEPFAEASASTHFRSDYEDSHDNLTSGRPSPEAFSSEPSRVVPVHELKVQDRTDRVQRRSKPPGSDAYAPRLSPEVANGDMGDTFKSNTETKPAGTLAAVLSDDASRKALVQLIQAPSMRPVLEKAVHSCVDALVEHSDVVLRELGSVLRDHPALAVLLPSLETLLVQPKPTAPLAIPMVTVTSKSNEEASIDLIARMDAALNENGSSKPRAQPPPQPSSSSFVAVFRDLSPSGNHFRETEVRDLPRRNVLTSEASSFKEADYVSPSRAPRTSANELNTERSAGRFFASDSGRMNNAHGFTEQEHEEEYRRTYSTEADSVAQSRIAPGRHYEKGGGGSRNSRHRTEGEEEEPFRAPRSSLGSLEPIARSAPSSNTASRTEGSRTVDMLERLQLSKGLARSKQQGSNPEQHARRPGMYNTTEASPVSPQPRGEDPPLDSLLYPDRTFASSAQSSFRSRMVEPTAPPPPPTRSGPSVSVPERETPPPYLSARGTGSVRLCEDSPTLLTVSSRESPVRVVWKLQNLSNELWPRHLMFVQRAGTLIAPPKRFVSQRETGYRETLEVEFEVAFPAYAAEKELRSTFCLYNENSQQFIAPSPPLVLKVQLHEEPQYRPVPRRTQDWVEETGERWSDAPQQQQTRFPIVEDPPWLHDICISLAREFGMEFALVRDVISQVEPFNLDVCRERLINMIAT